MKLLDIWKEEGSKVAQREVQRLLAFAGFDPNAEAPDIQALYKAIRKTLWEQGILPQKKTDVRVRRMRMIRRQRRRKLWRRCGTSWTSHR